MAPALSGPAHNQSMCGIAGIVGLSREYRANPDVIHRMCETIRHRGPDDEGVFVSGSIALGMRRLSIIDLEGGKQPIHNEDRSVWAVFNGEIYNFAELRADLKLRGHEFYSNTDGEVLVHLYEERGNDFVSALRGMFAIAICDIRNQSLLLARDRFGKKPLHYALTEYGFVFGSEIKQILTADPSLLTVDPSGLLNFFYFGYTHYPQTAFRAIKRLPPAHILEFKQGAIKQWRYWALPRNSTGDESSEKGWLDALEAKVEEAVRLRMIADVPIGALLSGGVDSSIVVALMSRNSASQIATFSIRFGEREFDESHFARLVSAKFKTRHYEFQVEPQIEATVDLLSRTLEEPFADSSIIPMYHVCRLAKQHVTVCLGGDGGDELFGGYDRYARYLKGYRRVLLPQRVAEFYRHRVHPLLPWEMPGRRFLYQLAVPRRERYIEGMAMMPALGRERSLFTDDFLSSAAEAEAPDRVFLTELDGGSKNPLEHIREAMYLDTTTYLPGDILTKVDRMSMANSLEVRAPFLDHILAELVWAMPLKLKFRLGESKYILKRVAERLGVPRDAIYRRKQGFAVPLVQWFRQNPMPPLLEILLEPQTLQRGYFNPNALRRRVREHRSGIRDRSTDLWQVLVLELWHRNFLSQIAPAGTRVIANRVA
jgi:asparagine synthase (glutamine-hydrolysing)